ncbi:LysE family translocator [Dyella jiangningensis]|uniref:Amino acid transporter n=1 Tax=Dyella jiangningensis TaxID=1379159 RepID=A0A328PA57_9GAMM|nr:LysE family translocator [Dyella jiangningensis]RAO78091.1 amino acid transporter [Dyella jiangningensis]
MDTHTLSLFAITVLPLICAPGPDMLFIVSQAMSGSTLAGWRATSGVCAGYIVHSLLVAFGLAAVVAASPLIFESLRWAGVAYLGYLAFQLLRSASKPQATRLARERAANPFGRGFLTAALNPKGMMIYFAILPQFMRHDQPAAEQALLLSAIFIGLCALVYTTLSIIVAAGRGKAGVLDDRRRRCIEGVSGGVLIAAAAKLASN